MKRLPAMLLFLLLAAASMAQAAQRETLVLARVSTNPKKHYATMLPLVRYAASRMEDLGIKGGDVLLAKDEAQMLQYLKEGRVDWVTETPMAASLYHEEAGARYLLRRWKKGVASYHTVIFVRKDSGINRLAELKGKTIAFEDPGSTSAYYVPASTLIGSGLKLVRLDSPRSLPVAGHVGYLFAGQEINSTTWVYKGLVQAAALSNLDWERPSRVPTAFKKELRIIHRSVAFPRAVELVRPGLDKEVAARLASILLNADEDQAGRAALQKYEETSRFDRLDAEGLAGLREAGRLRKIVSEALL